MADRILLNHKEWMPGEENLPCLITYKEKSGGSLFTVAMVANMFLEGSKLLFLTGYPMARDNFLEQIGESRSDVALVHSIEGFEDARDVRGVILESGNEDLFLKVMKIPDAVDDRVVLVKNVDVFSDAVFDACLGLKRLVLSGDIDRCGSRARIAKKDFATTVFFSKPEIDLHCDIPVLEQWTGYLSGSTHTGVVRVDVSGRAGQS